MAPRKVDGAGLKESAATVAGEHVGLITAKIEMLAISTTFDVARRTGQVPINVSILPQSRLPHALQAMKSVFRSSLYFSYLVAVAEASEFMGEVIVPREAVGLVTISNIVVKGALLKAGIPMVARFGGVLQFRDYGPLRFVDLIEYAGSSLDPAEIFIAGKMTSVTQAARRGNGNILASFWEIPGLARPATETLVSALKDCGMNRLVIWGKTSEPVCGIPVSVDNVGIILIEGLNPVAAAVEAGVEITNHAMSGLIEFERLRSFWSLFQ